jgi:hypothetical protein
LWKVDQHGFGKTLKVVLDSVLHDIIDVNDKLFKLSKTLMNMVEISVNVHGSPGEGNHTWSKFVLKILEMWDKKRFGVWSDLVDNSIVFLENKLKLVVVHLKLVFLKKDDLGAFWNVNSNSGKAFGFSDKSKDLRVEVNVKFIVLWVSDYQSSLQTSFSFLNFVRPLGSPEILEGEEGVTDLIIHLDESSGFLLFDKVLWELLHWSRDSMEEMSRPGDGTRDCWQVSDNWWRILPFLILVFDLVNLNSVVLEQDGVFGVQSIS